ncbi:MAG: serine kinase, partial [Bacteroidetes bacterium]|nr:serine kinase [Bacteroidota bacterium]
FPELLPYQFEKAEVTVHIGKTPKSIEGDDVLHKVSVSMSPNQYLLHLLNIANYYAANGNQIVIEPLQGSDENSLRLFALSNAFSAILYQRNSILLHASGVFFKHGVILFCGNSGAGKSTLITALQQKGYQVFTDDVCVLQPQLDNSIKVIPSYPMIKLWEDSFTKIGISDWGEKKRIRDHLPKYAHYFHNQFITVPQNVLQLFVLDNSHTNSLDVQINQLTALEAFDIVEKNSYRQLQMIMMKKRKLHFKQIALLINGLPVYKCNRPESENTIDTMIAKIENCFV